MAAPSSLESLQQYDNYGGGTATSSGSLDVTYEYLPYLKQVAINSTSPSVIDSINFNGSLMNELFFNGSEWYNRYWRRLSNPSVANVSTSSTYNALISNWNYVPVIAHWGYSSDNRPYTVEIGAATVTRSSSGTDSIRGTAKTITVGQAGKIYVSFTKNTTSCPGYGNASGITTSVNIDYQSSGGSSSGSS